MKQRIGNVAPQLNRYIWATVVVWTVVLLLSLTWNRVHSELNAMENARIQARTAHQKDILYRRWNSRHGGVYVPISPLARPNPHLDVPNRDLAPPLAPRLTLINPAYMLRMVYELGEARHGIKGRITSLRPIRPQNAPDAWETKALQSFEQGGTEVSNLMDIDGDSHMRLMRPLYTEKSCLKCHGKQGYEQGMILGGISVSVPMAPLKAAMKPYHMAVILGHFLLWLFGCGGIWLVAGRLSRQVRQRKAMEQALKQSEERARVLVEHAPFGLSIMGADHRFEYLNPKFIQTFGYTLEDIPDKSAWFDKAYPDPVYRRTVRDVWLADSAHAAGSMETVEPRTFRVRDKDGRDRVIRFNNVPVADGRQLLTYEDISIQVAAESALRESERNLHDLSSGLLKAQEKERRRIAYALHDELAQDLAVLTIEVKCIEEALEDHQEALKAACRKTHQNIIGIIDNTRRLSQGLSPALLEELGLTAAVRRMIEDFSNQAGVSVSVDMENIDQLFRHETEVIVYRIFQEAFTNIRKHAYATRVEVTVSRRDGQALVCIEDNGRGFHPGSVSRKRRPGKGLGLIAMEERVRMLGKTLHRVSDPGRGTSIAFAIPEDLACPPPEDDGPGCAAPPGE